MDIVKHKRNENSYAVKRLHGFNVSVKQTSNNKWEDGILYFNPMEPYQLYVTGKERFKDHFEDQKAEYNGDELYDDIYNAIHATFKDLMPDQGTFYTGDFTNVIIKKIQPKIEALNNKIK